MFCGNCGTENTNGAKFCKGCGKPLNNMAAQSNADKRTDKITAVPKKLLIGIGAACVAIILIICIALNAGSRINLNKYLTIEADGYDGYGTLKANIDWDAIETKYGSKLSFTKQAQNEYGGFISIITPVEAIQDSIKVELKETSGLSNGDEVTYTWDIDEDLSTYVNCKVKYKDGSFRVSGLTEIGTFDAFSGLDVTFMGVAPNGSVNINYSGSEMSYYDFSCDKTNGLSNGDTVVISIDDSKLEYCAKNLGKVPEMLEKEYTVEGLSSYVSKISEINEAGLASMQQQAVDVYNAYIAQSWGEGEALESLTYIGNYLLTTKNQNLWGSNNIIYLVYRAQVRNNYSNGKETYNKINDDYWYISFDDIMVGSDGNLTIDITAYSTPTVRFTIDSGISSGWWSTKSWSYYGYQTLDELYKGVVTSNIDVYNHEDNVDEAAAPEVVEVEIEDDITKTGYVFPNSDSEILTKADLEGLSAEECKIARNEIYARHGRKFKDEELQSYFDSCDWYEGTIEPDDFQESDLTDIEIANKDLIVEYEEEKGYR